MLPQNPKSCHIRLYYRVIAANFTIVNELHTLSVYLYLLTVLVPSIMLRFPNICGE